MKIRVAAWPPSITPSSNWKPNARGLDTQNLLSQGLNEIVSISQSVWTGDDNCNHNPLAHLLAKKTNDD